MENSRSNGPFLKLTFILIAFTLFLSTITFAQENNNYDDLWTKVEGFKTDGRTNSAMEITEEIYSKAVRDGLDDQRIKAIIYKNIFRSYKEEKATEKSIWEMEKELLLVQGNAKAILHSAIAQLYWWYYSQNRWNIHERSGADTEDKHDLSTWSAKEIIEKINEHYEASVQDAESLQNTSPAEFDVILDKSERGRIFRPTMFDVLIWRGINFYANSESGLTRPKDQFFVNDEMYYSKLEKFAILQLDGKDSMSFELKTVQLYQQLIAFHLRSSYKDALYYTDLQRLDFVKSKYNAKDSDDLYLEALEDLKERSTDSVKGEVMYAIAKQYKDKGQKFHAGQNDEYRWHLKKSLSICLEVISNYPNSSAAKECKNLATTLRAKTLIVKTETVVSSKSGFLAFYEYKNLNEIHFRIIENEEKLHKNSGRERNFNLKEYLSKPFLHSGSFNVPDSGDHQSHSVEFSFPKLKPGYYSILTSLKKDFKTEDNLLVKNDFWVSDLAYFQLSESDGEVKLFVVDRNTGTPLADVSAQLYVQEYNYYNRENDIKASGEAVSDENGKISLKNENGNANYIIMLAKGKDSLLISSPVYVRKSTKPKERTITRTYMFTDRQIYRPGQRVYFKGIVMEKKKFDLNLIVDKKLNVSIYNVNNEEVGKIALSTNEYGTYHGNFDLPFSGLTGKYYITDGISRHYISIEEYKRPSFRIETDSLKGNYKIGEGISISGNAIAWNGSPIQNALVTYSVMRMTSYPYWGDSYRPFTYLSSDDAVIEQGEIITNKLGKWRFEFEALPDPKTKRLNKPVFDYHIAITVTDINGETQNSKSVVRVGHEALLLSMNLSDEMEFGEADTLLVTTSNLQGGFTPAMVEVSFFKLEAPAALERRKLWPIPEYKLLDSASYKSRHLLDHYLEDQNLSNWVISEKAIATTINTEENRRIVPKNMETWIPGAYMVQLRSSDPYGNEVNWEKRFILYSKVAKDLPRPSWMWISPIKESYKVGEKAEILVGSSKKNAMLFYSFRDKSGILKESWLKMTGKTQRIGIPIFEGHRGNLGLQFFLIHSGRSYKFDQVIQVPYDNKKLSLKLETFRSELEPGSQEKWTLSVKSAGELKIKEVLASMYDMSLDAFKANDWSFNPYQEHYPIQRIFSGFNFNSLNGRTFSFYKDNYLRHSPWKFDDINWFGLNVYGYQSRMPMAIEYSEMANDEGDISTKGKATRDEFQRLPTKSVAAAAALPPSNESSFQLRRNFDETAFFYPELRTDSSGVVKIEFEVPDALTKWKFQALAISKDIDIGTIQEQIVTKKDLMIIPNYPRFLTTGDTIILSAKIINVSDQKIEGKAQIGLSSYLDQNKVSLELISEKVQEFDLAANSSAAVFWEIACLNQAGLVEVKIFAESENHRDGELKILPLLSNEVLITDTYSVTVRSGKKKTIEIEHLNKEKMQNERPYRYSLEFTANPNWYVIQALPYLSELSKESSQDLFNRFFANSVGLGIVNDNQEISKVFEAWKMDPNASLSKLEINQELKQVLLSESPWLMEAKTESENKRKLGNFFDSNNLDQSLKIAEKELLELQSPNGGWPWFKGMRESRHITLNIVSGFAKLDARDFWDIRGKTNLWASLQLALNYLDQRILEDYNRVMAHKDNKRIYLGHQHIQYLYTRSFYKDVPMIEDVKKAHDYFLEQARANWLKNNKYLQAMLAVTFLRNEDKIMAEKIMVSIKENALYSDEFGMYWKQSRGYFWHESDLGRHAMLIEAFDEVMKDSSSVEEMKIWLLKQKQSRMWRTSKETTEACWALLTKGQSNLSLKGNVSIKMSGIEFDQGSIKKEAGSGYFKKEWMNPDINEDMANLEIENKGESMSWGAAYYQYYAAADEADLQSTGLSVTKEYYKIGQSDQGLTYDKVENSTLLKTSDRILVRLIIKSDRVLDFVHLNDKRASGLEPADSKSGYRYNRGSGYFLSVRDASHNFFFDQLRKGTMVLEYELKVNNSGDFSAGFAQIQCYYAPEFSARSKGSRLVVD